MSENPPPPDPATADPAIGDEPPIAAEARPAARRPRRLAVGAVLVAVFAAFAGIVWLAWLDGAGAGPDGEPPLIRADAGEIKVRPATAENGAPRPNVIGVLTGESPPARPERLMPAQEEPVLPPVLIDEPAPALVEEALAEEMPAGETLGEEVSPAAGEAAEAGTGVAVTESQPEPEPAALPGPVALPEPEANPEPASRAVAALEPAPAAAAPQPAQAIPPQAVRPAPPPKVTSPPPAPPSPPAAPPQEARATPAPLPAATPPSGPAFRMQLVAVRDEAAARRAWDQFRELYPGVLRGLEPTIERVETDAGVLHRLQAGPFRDRAAAEAACAELKRQDGDCFVVSPRT